MDKTKRKYVVDLSFQIQVEAESTDAAEDLAWDILKFPSEHLKILQIDSIHARREEREEEPE